MLGSQISPIKWTLVIIQVARQLLPRVIPETYIEISHCFWTGSGYPLIPTRTFTDSTTMCSYNTLVAGLFLQSTLVDWWCFFGFMATWILASTASLQFNDKLGLCGWWRGDWNWTPFCEWWKIWISERSDMAFIHEVNWELWSGN